MAAEEAMNASGLKVTMKHSFFCEKESNKQQWIKAFHCCGDNPDEWPCIFGAMETMQKETAHCYSHDKQCPIVAVFGVFIGSSCRYFSRRNQKTDHGDKAKLLSAARKAAQNSQATPDHQSAQTYLAFMSYLQRFKPAFWVFENTDAFLDKEEVAQKDKDDNDSNMAVVINDAAERGYDCQPFVTVSDEYGLPQERRRFFIAAMQRVTPYWTLDDPECDRTFKRFSDRMCRVRQTPPGVADILMSEKHPYIVSELARRTEHRAKAGPTSDGAGSSWQQQSSEWCRLHKLRWGAVDPAELTKNSPWFATLAKSQQEMIVYVQAVHGAECAIDLSQSLAQTRVIPAPLKSIRTLLPANVWWLSISEKKVARVLTGRESLTCQGWPWQRKDRAVLDKFSDSLMRDLAGNAFPGLVVLAIFDSLLYAAPWARQRSEAEVNAAFAMSGFC